MFVMIGVVGFGLSKQTLYACNNAGLRSEASINLQSKIMKEM
jgi:hypothetical protein